MSFFKNVTLLTMVIVVTMSCDDTELSGLPTVEDARAVIMNTHVASRADNPTLRDFKKIDGVRMEESGVRIYAMDVSYTLTWPDGHMAHCVKVRADNQKDYGVLRQRYKNARKFQTVWREVRRKYLDTGCDHVRGGIKAVGDTEKWTRILIFRKSERGWRADRPFNT